MATELNDIKTWWATQTDLQAALPVATKVYSDTIPAATVEPYAVIKTLPMNNNFQTGKPYWSSQDFQVNVYDTTRENVEALLLLVFNAFAWKTIASGCISVEPGLSNVVQDRTNPKKLWFGFQVFTFNKSKTLP